MRKLIKAFIPKTLFRIIEPYGHLLEAVIMNIYYGFPARNLEIIGVTGTDGKTTTATIITSMLKQAGYKTGMLTTVSVDYGDGPQPNNTRMTVMPSGMMLREIKKMKQKGIKWLVLETTSHALAQNRVWGVPYSLAVMTNVAHEHLDYHGSFENYLNAKKKLFTLVGRNRRGRQAGVVNDDDPSAGLFAAEVANSIRYGLKEGASDVYPLELRSTAAGSTYHVRRGAATLKITTHLPGSFNVSNSLAAVCVGLILELTDEQIEKGIASLEAVEGRMTQVNCGQDFNVIVDYAHTPDSFEKVFNELAPMTEGRLIVVFGSAGERDHAKRPLQGEIAGRLCDIVVVTEEDDRSEDGMMILDEIAAGAEQAGKAKGKDLFLIHDRAEAIQKAVSLARTGDTVLMLGKGHEKSILGSSGKRPWNEVEAAQQALKLKTE
ncbi:MAG TPA: UDP-N-acetylmuramoyl-L-alanyl-D-glutamate--2,6-diaminopimelate ligase [Candidatus Dormibacteraeota bacterium]|nr:UDP-N-acetylmuramoyl-L-alanyl-D-glutamate--2,6-diaminopimelate ligase [Candidatus Dormibacteraeota bacterium]